MKQLKLLGGLFIVFALGAAAFAFAQDTLLGQTASASDPVQMIQEIAIEDEFCDENDVCETTAGTVSVGFDEAEGLPEIAPDMIGLFVAHSGDTVTIGTGNIEVEVNVEQVNDNDPVTAVSAVFSGPELEIMVSAETQIYADVTPHAEPTRADLDAGQMTVQRVVEAGALGDISDGMMIRAWGIMDGDVLNADVLVYEPIR